MTPEQLDDIEKLAEAATPGPWNHSFEFIHPQDGGISDAFIVCRHTEGGYDAAFLCEMREYALPLVKALREARAALDQVSSDDRMSEAQITATIRHAQAQTDEAIRQRDQALELKRYWAADADAKEALLQSVARVCRGAKEPDQADLSVLGNVLRERDEARAEVERLRSALRLLWEEAQDKCAIRDDTTDTVDAALKEGDR